MKNFARAGVSITKKPLFFVFVFWLLYPCVPSFRDNLKQELSTPGVALNDTGCGGLWGTPPGYEEPTFGLPFSGDPRWERLNPQSMDSGVLLKRFSRDRAVIAWWLSLCLFGMEEGHTWQFPVPWVAGPDPGAARDLLGVARHGEIIDPGNAFFPWIAGQAEIYLCQRQAAIRELQRGVQCTRYDDYLTNFYADSLAFERSRGMGSLGETYFLVVNRRLNDDLGPAPIEYPIQTIGSLIGQFYDDKPGPQFDADFQLLSLVMKLGKLQRTEATTPDCRYLGACTEYAAAADSEFFLTDFRSSARISGSVDFGQPLDSRLVTSAASEGHPEIARMALQEWAAAPQVRWEDYESPFVDTRTPAIDATWCQRVERLILRSLPFCVILLAVNGLFLRWKRESSSVSRAWSWRGPLTGGVALAFLLAADWLVSVRSIQPQNLPAARAETWVFWAGPGIASAAPALTWAAAGLFLLGASYGVAMLDLPADGGSAQVRLWVREAWVNRDGIVAARNFAWLILWLLPWACVLLFAWATYGPVPLAASTGFVNYAPQTRVLAWSPLLLLPLAIAAFLPWFLARRTAERKRVARAELQRLLAGYLVAATILFAALEVPRAGMQAQFDSGIRRMIEMGG